MNKKAIDTYYYTEGHVREFTIDKKGLTSSIVIEVSPPFKFDYEGEERVLFAVDEADGNTEDDNRADDAVKPNAFVKRAHDITKPFDCDDFDSHLLLLAKQNRTKIRFHLDSKLEKLVKITVL